MRPITAILLALLLTACGTTQYPMPYAPTSPVTAQQPPGPVARTAAVRNSRATGGEDPVWIGTIRGGYGNPIRTLQADRPLDQAVQRAFNDGLAARGWLAQQAPRVEIEITIREFVANRYVRLEATAELELVLRERGSGRVLWQDREKVNNVEGSILALDTGVFADPAGLHALMLRTMNQAIDRLLDRPGFAAALLQAR
ncbi:hypothetical protein EJV46_02200 [Roseococcus sp. SYP-B2431]|uniref:hypothetical protein n=1 Tax=Roseococcus sp. SYP-B2431 TaxID=2496640 RepID=UPI00104063E6|nr:hypothetical protein [Roseococcus sp. SYP-B2431]TCH99511.1 hypothetical protein EJV46_02200 [Roseococcus sp. SYP-B2431]